MADDFNDSYTRWLNGIRSLVASADSARAWREERWRFAHRLGEALVGERNGCPPVAGPALYGIWLPWGLLYVGQTSEAYRRLRDLPVGESHHLANTFPPEIWDRVVVIAWPRLPEADEPTEVLGAKTVGLALEHQLQLRARPLANAARRTGAGEWRDVDLIRSKSAGALASSQIDGLAERVLELWTMAAGTDVMTPVARVVRPAEFLAANHKA